MLASRALKQAIATLPFLAQRVRQRAIARIAERWNEFRGYTPTDRNIFYLCVEILPAGIASGMVSFNGPFVLKLGGEDTLIGLMASLPALASIIFAIVFGQLMERQRNRKPLMMGGLVAARGVFLLIGIVPWVLPKSLQPGAIVGLAVLQAIPLALFNAGWLSLLADLCPPDRRSSFFSMRWFLLAVTVGVSAFLSGLWLEAVPFPLNYQTLNIAACLIAQYSTYLVSRPIYPEYNVRAQSAKPTKTETATSKRPAFDWRSLRNFTQANRGFVNVNLTILITFLGVWGAGPLLTLYFVNTLKLSEGWLGVNGFLSQAGVAAGALIGSALLRRVTSMWLLRRIMLVFWLYPLIIVLVPIPQVIWAVSFLCLTLDPVLNVTLLNVLYDFIPEQRRSSWMSSHVALMNVGAMIAPLLTVELANSLTVQTALLICAAVRVIGIILFFILPLSARANTTDQQPAAGLNV